MPSILPFNATPVNGADGVHRNDAGKRVVINSVGGALVNVEGTVLCGPYIFWYEWWKKVEVQKYSKKPIFKHEIRWSCPTWKILVDYYNLELTFAETELTII